jgi:hypothetical protein
MLAEVGRSDKEARRALGSNAEMEEMVTSDASKRINLSQKNALLELRLMKDKHGKRRQDYRREQ